MRDLKLAFSQTGYELRGFARNRARATFTFGFPLMFLVIFASINSGTHISRFGGISYDQYFVPGILAYAVISTSFVNIAITTAIRRDSGVMKRMQGTPLPLWAYTLALIMSTFVIVAAMCVVTLVIGDIAYGVKVPGSRLGAIVAALLMGTAAFTTLGIGVVRLIPNADAAPAVVNLLVLPLTFISGVWFVTANMSSFLQDIAKVFPVRPLADALQYAFNPHTTGSGFRDGDLSKIAVWLVVGLVMMLAFLRAPAGDAR